MGMGSRIDLALAAVFVLGWVGGMAAAFLIVQLEASRRRKAQKPLRLLTVLKTGAYEWQMMVTRGTTEQGYAVRGALRSWYLFPSAAPCSLELSEKLYQVWLAWQWKCDEAALEHARWVDDAQRAPLVRVQ